MVPGSQACATCAADLLVESLVGRFGLECDRRTIGLRVPSRTIHIGLLLPRAYARAYAQPLCDVLGRKHLPRLMAGRRSRPELSRWPRS